MMNQKTVAEVVAENIKTAHVFKKFGIDFCCGGGVSIEKACEKRGIDVDTLERELLAVDNTNNAAHNFNGWEIDFLSDYIINTHHAYVLEAIPLTIQYAEKVAKVHGHANPELIEINELFSMVAEDLLTHMKKEEHILFPYIKHLVATKKSGAPYTAPPFVSATNPIRMMEAEHEAAGDIMKKIAELSNQYQVPEHACNTYKALFSKLEEFEEDLHQHVHLENNILFPKAIKLEQDLNR
ncbi:MAG: iron-sulfur cluster repair di-iron protein [Bacteroidia bacterium]|jgi:regulator of cell morphogenesis and NO signaling|nr:iron-sulfur cluster repair di-iron protein [Bacteroidia bacterium]